MAAPNEDSIQAQTNNFVWLVHQALLALNTNSENFGGIYDDIIAAQVGDFIPRAIPALDEWRATAASLVSPERVRPMIDQCLREYAKQQGFPETSPLAILDRLFIYFGEGSERVTTRGFTFGTPSAGGGNTGDGILNRLTTDRYGFDIEAATKETKTFRCIRDVRSGALSLHRETFEIRGEDVPRDFVAGIVGAQRIGEVSCLSADSSLDYLNNPSFGSWQGTTGTPTSITSWTPTSSISNFSIEDTDVYRTAVHEGESPYAVRFTANDTLTQLLSVRRGTFFPNTPYYCQLAFKRENSCDGTLTIAVGGNTKAATLSAQSGWTILRLDLDENLFLRNFNETAIDVTITLGSNTTGEVLVDDIVFGPMTQFDGTWWAPVGGATPFLLEDSFTAQDTATESILQYWLWRLYGRYLAHDTSGSGNVTWAEPS